MVPSLVDMRPVDEDTMSAAGSPNVPMLCKHFQIMLIGDEHEVQSFSRIGNAKVLDR
jgi:Icc-related predicted phosphoesterase